MARRAETKPRKGGSQSRSRATVDALIEATARVLTKEGYERTTTNRIAFAAGVSIGSLYQYFPGKEALVAAVVERHARDLSRVVRDTYLRIATLPIETGAREFVQAAIAAHRVDPRLHRILDEEVPRAGLNNVDAAVQNANGLFRAYLEAHRGEIDVVDPELAAFILVTTVEALTHSAVLHRPEILAGEKAAAFVDEVTGLILRYLLPRSGRRRRRARPSARSSTSDGA